MTNVLPQQPASPNHTVSDPSLDRRAFLSASAKTVAGVAVGGALAQAGAGRVLADVAKLRTINIVGKATVTLTCAYIGNANEAKGTQQLFDMFYAQNGHIKVQVLAIPVPTWSQYFDKILTMIAGGSAPDIGRVATEGALLVAKKNLVLPLDPFIKGDPDMADYFNDVSPKLVDTFRYNGKLLALPFDWNELMIHYNTGLFKKLGIAAPAANWTGDDFVAIGKKLVASGAYGYNLWASPGTFFIVAWMYAAGGALYNKDLTKSNATDPANVKAMQFLQDLIYKYKVSPRPGSPDFPLLEGGRVGMISDGRWSLNTFEVAKFKDYQVQLMPALGPQRKMIYGVGGFPVFRQSKYPEEAWQAAKFMTTRQAMAVGTKLGLSNAPRRSVLNNPSLALPPGVPNYNYKIYYDALTSSQAVPAPPQYNEVETALIAGFSRLVANEVSATTMLQTLDAQITKILATPV